MHLLGLVMFLAAATETATLPSVGTTETAGISNGVTFEVTVQGPAGEETPLQIACLFEYLEGDIYTSPPALSKELNGMVHVDEALSGLITDIRKSKKFEGKALETLLIVPPANTLKAQKLLLIGLGDRTTFQPETMRLVGLVGMREALRLGVDSYAHASDLKDAGYSSPTADVAGYVVQGALEAYQTQSYLLSKNASDPLTVKKVTLLAGPAYLSDSVEGAKKIIEGETK